MPASFLPTANVGTMWGVMGSGQGQVEEERPLRGLAAGPLDELDNLLSEADVDGFVHPIRSRQV